MEFKHPLGVRAKDMLTGFTGVITSRTQFVMGCNRYCLQPVVDRKTGKLPDAGHFDEGQIQVLSKPLITEAPPAGPVAG